jgi:hypothetical protein
LWSREDGGRIDLYVCYDLLPMLLFHRGYSGEHEELHPFRLTVSGSSVEETRQFLTERYQGNAEFYNASDLNRDIHFRTSLMALRKTSQRDVLRLLAEEFTEAYDDGIQMQAMANEDGYTLDDRFMRQELPLTDMMFLYRRFEGTGLEETVRSLMEEHHDHLSVVIPAIRTAARGAAGHVKTS